MVEFSRFAHLDRASLTGLAVWAAVAVAVSLVGMGIAACLVISLPTMDTDSVKRALASPAGVSTWCYGVGRCELARSFWRSRQFSSAACSVVTSLPLLIRISFCTIINLQGRKSRRRSPDDVEHTLHKNYEQGIDRFFITDDNFARNKDWDAIFDRIIKLPEQDAMDAGYILGFPDDTPESAHRDIEIIKEMLLEVLEFFYLTPLPGSEDDKSLATKGVPLDPDVPLDPELNTYDLEHTLHPNMSNAEWEKLYRDAWDIYYTPSHIKTILRRAQAYGINIWRLEQN